MEGHKGRAEEVESCHTELEKERLRVYLQRIIQLH